MIDPGSKDLTLEERLEWLKTSRICMFETYRFPFFPELEFDAEKAIWAVIAV